MVFGVILANIEDKSIYFNQFYGETANDTKKNHRIKFLLTKLQENCVQQIEICREKQKIFNFFQKNDIVNQKIKNSFMQDSPITQEKSTHKGFFLIHEEKLFPKDLIGHWLLKEKLCICILLNSAENEKIGNDLLEKILTNNHIEAQNWENNSLMLDILIPEGQLTFYSPSNIHFYLSNK